MLERLEAGVRESGADRVAGLGAGGWLLAAVLADRTGRPFVSLPLSGTGEGGPGRAAEEGDRVLLVVPVATGRREEIEAAIRTLTAGGAVVAGVAALAPATDEEDVRYDDIKSLYVI